MAKAPIAAEAVMKIDALFAIEREINGRSAAERLVVRRDRMHPIVDDLEIWLIARLQSVGRCRMACSNAHAYHYEMANSLPAFNEAIPRIASYRNCKYLYLATHGNNDALEMFNGEKVEIKYLNEMLRGLPKSSRIVGVYLAACSTANPEVARELLGEDSKLTWLVGYSKNVDWLPSSAFDMLFFKELTFATDQSEMTAIKQIAEKLKILVPGLIEDLGCSIFVRSRGSVIDLLDQATG